MLDKSIFEPKFGSWFPKIEPFFDTLYPIYKEIRRQSVEQNKMILPQAKDTLKAFALTDYNNLKCVVLGLSPYHSLSKKREIIADGIALSCSYTKELQPSLVNWYDALETEFEEPLIRNPDLSYLCENGILMLNLALTTEYLKAGSHVDLWKPFMQRLFMDVISVTGVPVLMLGSEAEVAEKWLAPFQWNFKISHPASVQYSGAGSWDSKGVFKKIKRIVKDNNGFDLQWYLPKSPF